MNENTVQSEKRPSLTSMQLPEHLKKLSLEQCQLLCKDIRSLLVQTVSKNGGHLASNLGVVELTVSMHRVFDSPQDKFVWDVGHQCYTHKILTGRYAQFATLRQEKGISGFPKPEESPHDTFISGHSSTAISVASGIAEAMRLDENPHHVIAVLGDGAMTGGLAFEGLNNAGKSKNHLIVILNDNAMSISKNVGSVAKYLSNIRGSENYVKTKKAVERKLQKTPVIGAPVAKMLKSSKDALRDTVFRSATIFEDFGFVYLGPVDGHNLEDLEEVLQAAKTYACPVFVHVHTVKGKGLEPAEANKEAFHYIMAGTLDKKPETAPAPVEDSYTSITREFIRNKIKSDKRAIVINAGTPGVFGFDKEYREELGPQYSDVGIAEEHAVAYASALAKNGAKPIFTVMSSFIQRTYDQLSQDLGLNNSPITMLVYWGGISGADATHLCSFDIPMISNIPNLVYLSPTNKEEYLAMLEYAYNQNEHPVAIRVPMTGLVSTGIPDTTR